MQTQYKAKPITLLVMFTMVLCIVFASSLKVATDLGKTAKKVTSQQLLEEEPNEKEIKVGKEVFTKYHFSQDFAEVNFINPSLKSVFKSLIKFSNPYLKVHTPPPDFFIFLS
ncbi:hypothetical protein AXE80_00630 [Wenyingzhuangia fucanilytica]|uniref:Uncharacterized protein n=1 Tax=Wenyingzhuangia fucanilytica TaxID=1790137 RepID=A0A1B1Y2B4_9FLAO|nr:hypothetical protein [Wenyingzhuangia fucanilytica]ANW94887.1 hypothetical protein AXE80_00630 [Wenyingzhuangia fucanilytica]